jgi:methionyl-tRNA formyltransferase
MRAYFRRVISAETLVFGRPRFLPAGVRQLAIKMGDLNRLEPGALAVALQSDAYIVFGSSYIKGALCDHLVAHRAVNIHMGVSPYYRGSGTNFWAMYDNRPGLVGATLHLLTRGLDSGPILCHALPKPEVANPFVIGMQAVRAAHRALLEHLGGGELGKLEPVEQDREREIRYSRHVDFTDEVAEEYLERVPSGEEMYQALAARDLSRFVRPYIG